MCKKGGTPLLTARVQGAWSATLVALWILAETL